MEYNFIADILNKFLQLTPWVQVTLGIVTAAVMVSPFYFLAQIMRLITERNKELKREWKDSYYRGGDEKV